MQKRRPAAGPRFSDKSDKSDKSDWSDWSDKSDYCAFGPLPLKHLSRVFVIRDLKKRFYGVNYQF